MHKCASAVKGLELTESVPKSETASIGYKSKSSIPSGRAAEDYKTKQ